MMRILRAVVYCSLALVVAQVAAVEDARAQVVNSSGNSGKGNWNVSGNWTPNTAAPNNRAASCGPSQISLRGSDQQQDGRNLRASRG